VIIITGPGCMIIIIRHGPGIINLRNLVAQNYDSKALNETHLRVCILGKYL